MLRAPTTSLLALAAAVTCLLAPSADACDKPARSSAGSKSACVAKSTTAKAKTAIAKPAAATARIATTKSATAKAAPGTAGMRVAIDPETGALVPDASQPAPGDASVRVGADLERLRQNIVVEHRADGSMHANVDGIVEDYAIATIGSDGQVQFSCVQGRDQAEKAVQKTARVRSAKRGAK